MIYHVEITPFRVELVRADNQSACAVGDRVVFRSKEGVDIGRVVLVQEDDETACYGEMVRVATPEDLAKRDKLFAEYAVTCLEEFKKAIREFNLDIKPVFIHCQLDEERVIFYFTAEKKVEFRRLHRNISQKLNRRVVIKQIGSRDFARIFGGVGPCGRNLCCGAFLNDLKSISLRMAREQKLYVSPGKLSGICGKLLCCLNFEEDFYTDFQNKEKTAETKIDPVEEDIS
jgi:cell fate regulator YaaT (PSP1 superfamily)